MNEKLDRKFRTWLVRRLSSSKCFLHSHVQKTVCKPQWSDNRPKSHLIIHFLCWKKKSQFFSHPTYALFLFHFVGFPARSNTDWRVSPHTHEHREKESRPTFLELGKSWMISWQKKLKKKNWEKPSSKNGYVYKIGWVFYSFLLWLWTKNCVTVKI